MAVLAGAGAAIRDSEDRLLLIQRLNPPEAGSWGLPGGKIDWGETARDTACREIEEELGIRIELLGLACLAETMDPAAGVHWIAPVYDARILSGTPSNLEPDKHGGWGWFALDELPAFLSTPARAWLESRSAD
jgi:8-oxo-dGTP diphosphatase